MRPVNHLQNTINKINDQKKGLSNKNLARLLQAYSSIAIWNNKSKRGNAQRNKEHIISMLVSSKKRFVRTEGHIKTEEMDKQETTCVWIQAHLPSVWCDIV